MSIATKVGKNAFAAEVSSALPKQKALISAKLIPCNTPADGSQEVLFYHPYTVNVLLLTNTFLLSSAWVCKRPQIHVGIHGGFPLSPSQCKCSTTNHIFSLADVAIVWKSVCVILWFLLTLFYFNFLPTSPQVLIIVFCYL